MHVLLSPLKSAIVIKDELACKGGVWLICTVKELTTVVIKVKGVSYKIPRRRITKASDWVSY